MNNDFLKALESDQSRQILEGSQCMEDKNITGEFPAYEFSLKAGLNHCYARYSHSFKICKVLLP